MTDMNWLIQWYNNQCDGVWEQENGLAISTLENPGWYMTIPLTGTKQENAEFQEVAYQSDDDEHDWYHLKISDKDEDGDDIGLHFIAACGPANFNRVILEFKKFVEGKGA